MSWVFCLNSPGAIFDEESTQAHTAFRYVIGKHNNSTADVKLDKIVKMINISNDYELSRTRKYHTVESVENAGISICITGYCLH